MATVFYSISGYRRNGFTREVIYMDFGGMMPLKEIPYGRRFAFRNKPGGGLTTYKPLITEYLDPAMKDFVEKSIKKQGGIACRRTDNEMITIFSEDLCVIALDWCQEWVRYREMKQRTQWVNEGIRNAAYSGPRMAERMRESD